MSTAIPYLDEMWSVTTGCGDDMASPGCLNCYARRMFGRNLWKCPECGGDGLVWRDLEIPGLKSHEYCPACRGTGHRDFTPTFHADRLKQPLHWRKPRRIGVSFMGDLFHEAFTDTQIAEVLRRTIQAHQHTYLILTKRPERMRRFMTRWTVEGSYDAPNLWLGVTVCNQEEADRLVPLLLGTPAAVRWVSLESMLGAVKMPLWLPNPPGCHMVTVGGLEWKTRLDWVVLGGETGPGARPMDPRWATQVFKDCREAGVPFWFKQPGSHLAREDKLGPTGRDWALWDEMVRTRDLPAVTP